MSIRRTHPSRHEGVILIQVAVMILVLAALSTFVLDYGIVWVSRGQAQNAADAGALSGALSMAYEDFGNPPAAGGPADLAATVVARENIVWTEAPTPNVTWTCPAGVAGRCIRVDVHRDGLFGSTTLPAFFGPLLGVTAQRVRATATARVIAANSTNCMRPWSVADKWTHVVNPIASYDKWSKSGNTTIQLMPHDIYTPASAGSAGTGYTVAADLGTQLTMKMGNPQSTNEAIVAGWFLSVNLPDGAGGYNTGASPYQDAIARCIGKPVAIGAYLPVETGNMVGPTSAGFDLLKAQDPTATWNATTGMVENSCAPKCAQVSPRIVPIPVFDMDEFQLHRNDNNWSACPGGGKCVRVVNILGFFADRLDSQGVIGYLVTQPGEFVSGAPGLHDSASFLKSIQLVR